MKISTTWKRLPRDVVTSNDVNTFKNSIDKHWTTNSPTYLLGQIGGSTTAADDGNNLC